MQEAKAPGQERDLSLWSVQKFPEDDLLAHVRRYLNPPEGTRPTALLWQMEHNAMRNWLTEQIGGRVSRQQLSVNRRRIPFELISIQLALFRVGVGFLIIQAQPISDSPEDWLDFLHAFRFAYGQRGVRLQIELSATPGEPSPPEPRIQTLGQLIDNLLQTCGLPTERAAREVFVPGQLLPFAVLYVDAPRISSKRAAELLYRVRNFFHTGRIIRPSASDLSMPDTVDALFAGIYDEIAEKRNGQFTEAGRRRAMLAQMLALAFEPLSIEQLRDLLRLQLNTPLTLEETRDLLLPISEYLLRFEGDRFLLYHQGLADYLLNRVLAQDEQAQWHRQFAEWLMQPRQAQLPYRLRYLPRHLLACLERAQQSGEEELAGWAREQLHALLTDFEFIELKVQANLVPDLRMDYQHALRLLPDDATLHTWHRFIDGEGHILMVFPSLYLQQALNQPSESPVSQAAEAHRSRPTGRVQTPEYLMRWLNKPAQVSESPLIRTLQGHNPVWALAVLPDGHVVSGGEDCTLRIWDVERGECIAIFPTRAAVECCAVTPQGVIACGDGSGAVYFLRQERVAP